MAALTGCPYRLPLCSPQTAVQSLRRTAEGARQQAAAESGGAVGRARCHVIGVVDD
jgi:hypothetical protein